MSLVGYERRRGAAWLTLNRPVKLNALSEELVREFGQALDRALGDDGVKVVLVQGAGRAFCAGYDLEEEAEVGTLGADGWHRVLSLDVAVTMQLWELPKPTIAVVSGWCLGGGCEIAMACDLVIADEGAHFGEPEIRYGSGPVTLLMPFVLGQKKMSELLFTGDTLDASDAARFGLVNMVVSTGELEREATRIAERIAAAPLSTLRLTKMALNRAYEAMGIREAVNANLNLSAILNAANSPAQKEFDEIARSKGLKAALAWRDQRYV